MTFFSAPSFFRHQKDSGSWSIYLNTEDLFDVNCILLLNYIQVQSTTPMLLTWKRKRMFSWSKAVFYYIILMWDWVKQRNIAVIGDSIFLMKTWSGRYLFWNKTKRYFLLTLFYLYRLIILRKFLFFSTLYQNVS